VKVTQKDVKAIKKISVFLKKATKTKFFFYVFAISW